MEAASFVGLGGMGGAMAGRLAESLELTVFDLDASRIAAVKGASIGAGSLSEALKPGGVLLTMLPDDEAVAAVTDGDDGAIARLGSGGLHINMSTVSPATATRLADAYEAVGGSYVAAPVWGRPDMAGSGGLVCAVAGFEPGKSRAAPYLELLAARIEDFGSAARHANVAKVMGNFLVSAAIEALAEAMAVAEKQGVDREKLASLLTDTVFACPAYKLYGPIVARQKSIPTGFSAKLGLKDLRLVREVAGEVETPMPFQNVIENRLVTTIARGRGSEDWSALSWVAAEDAGITRPL